MFNVARDYVIEGSNRKERLDRLREMSDATSTPIGVLRDQIGEI